MIRLNRFATTLSPVVGAAILAFGCGNGANGSTTSAPADAADTAVADAGPAGCVVNADCADADSGPVCAVDTGACVPPPAGGLIGWGDGAVDSVTITEVYRPARAAESTDLEFHPERDELWVLHRRYEVAGVCTQFGGVARCESLGGYTSILTNPGTDQQAVDVREDENSFHFKRRPPALAMGAGETFATVGEAFTGNFEDEPFHFMGPTLWSTDLAIYARPSGFNGSHLDMLHSSPYGMGIAHERANIYWVFNGQQGAIDRYDFGFDHGPGHDDHSDGVIYRYITDAVARVPNTPSHMEYRDADAQLYIADSGNGRVIRLDTTSGTRGERLDDQNEPLLDFRVYDGATYEELVAPGVMTEPSGLAIDGDVIYVSDHTESRFYAFDVDGNLLRTLDTDLPPGTLAGIEVGRDGKLWFTDMLQGAVYRIDPF